MISRQQNLNLVDDKPKKLAVVRAYVLIAVALVVILGVIGVVIFLNIHGTKI